MPPISRCESPPASPPPLQAYPRGFVRERAAEAFRARKRNSELHSLRCDLEYKLNIARAFGRFDRFYFPHNVDFRGRAYPMHPHLNHLGSDMCRGLLQFADARPLGAHGLRWLYVQAANLWGQVCGWSGAGRGRRGEREERRGRGEGGEGRGRRGEREERGDGGKKHMLPNRSSARARVHMGASAVLCAAKARRVPPPLLPWWCHFMCTLNCRCRTNSTLSPDFMCLTMHVHTFAGRGQAGVGRAGEVGGG